MTSAIKKKSPKEAKGDCTVCKGWIDDGMGGACVFTDDYWTPRCPYDEGKKMADDDRGGA